MAVKQDRVYWSRATAQIIEHWEKFPASEQLDTLEFMTIALCGEVGEFANIVKKMFRAKAGFKYKQTEPEELESEAKEELVDILVYLVKLCELMNVHIARETNDKLAVVRERYDGDRHD